MHFSAMYFKGNLTYECNHKILINVYVSGNKEIHMVLESGFGHEGFMIETQLTVEFDHFVDKRYMRRFKIIAIF